MLKFVVVLAGVVAPVWACCPAMPDKVNVQIADQSVLIVYDEASQTEHFVRSAEFKTAEPGFGFLVPSPSQPALAEADRYVFERLRRAIAPKLKYVTQPRFTPSCLCLLPMRTLSATGSKAVDVTALAADAGVEVLEQTRVAGYDAAVLKASDPQLLADWLRDNDYSPRPDLKEWAEPYVDQGWIITAFKYSAESEGSEVTAKSVRMSFKTDRPVFPYRVPKDQIAAPGEGNMLRVFYVATGRNEGKLGSAKAPWKAELKYANAVEGLGGILAGAVPAGFAPAAGAWLNAYEDTSWPSGTEDLYFSTSSETAPVEPPPVIKVQYEDVPLPVDVILVLLLGVGYVVWRSRRVAAKA